MKGFLKRDLWVQLVVVIWLSIWSVTTWQQYFSSLVHFTLIYLPILLFAWFKPELKAKLKWWQYLAIPIIIFAGYCMNILWIIKEPNQEVIGTAFIISICIEVLLEISAHAGKLRQLRRINIEAAILLSIGLITGIGSALAVSGIGDPRFDKEGVLLIGGVFKPDMILGNFPLFLGYWLQFFLLWLAGYSIYYINHYFLVPRLLKERGILYYVAGAAGCMAILYPLYAQLINWLPFNKRFQIISSHPFDSENAFAVIAIIISTLPIILAIHWYRQNSKIATLEKQQVQTELEVLKQQINPHFFFNTLNNLYALSLTGSAKTPEVILQLSALMRYVIYEGQKDQVLISAEVQYIEDYLRLQKIRMHKSVDVQFEYELKDPAQQIPPLLLIILIENAFKHGVEPAEQPSFLHIKLESKEDEVYFTCKNSVEPAEKNTAQGIGLENLRRRLQLLYPGTHTLHTETDGHTFFAALKLKPDAAASTHH